MLFRMRRNVIEGLVEGAAFGIDLLGFTVTLTHQGTRQQRELKVALDFVRQVHRRSLITEAKESIDFPFALGA